MTQNIQSLSLAKVLFVSLVLSWLGFFSLGCDSGPPDSGMLAPSDIGSPCQTGRDCLDGLVCFSGVEGGYCTRECEEEECPEGSICSIMGGLNLCLFACSSDSECREGFACAQDVCRVVCETRDDCSGKENCQDGICYSDGIGGPCEDDGDCQAGMVCETSMPGGYCTFECDNSACPDGTTCLTFGGSSNCFDNCLSDQNCRSGYLCSMGVCNLPCSDDAECTGGFVCENSRCEGSGVGLPCSTGVDCEDGLSCYGGTSEGYCTIRCRDSDGCPVGSVCGNLKGELWCIAACRGDLDCGDSLICTNGGCTAPCESDSDCIDGMCDLETGICRGGDSEVLDFGDLPTGSYVEFEVDDMVHSFSVMLHGHQRVYYYVSEMNNPEGRNLVSRDLMRGPLRVYPMPEVFTVHLPNSDNSEVEVTPGIWGFRMDGFGGVAPATTSVLLRRTPDGRDRDGEIHLEVFISPNLFGTGVNADNAMDNSSVMTIMNRMEYYFTKQAGITIASIGFNDLPSNYSDIANDDAYREMFRTQSKPDVINVFFVRSITLGGESGVLGVSGGIPGPPRMSGTGSSGILLENMRGQAIYVGDGISHELGHFMGLYHTSESDQRTHDLISDTPICHDLQNCRDGWRNLMFPFLTGRADEITPGQSLVVRAFGGVD